MLSLLLAKTVPVHKSIKKWCCQSEFWSFSKPLANTRCTSLAFIAPRRSTSLNYTVTMLKAMEGTCPQPQQAWLLLLHEFPDWDHQGANTTVSRILTLQSDPCVLLHLTRRSPALRGFLPTPHSALLLGMSTALTFAVGEECQESMVAS